MHLGCRDISLNITALLATLLIVACSHPLEIKGEGDILSASGMRDCYLEDFQAGAENCTKNLVVDAYQEIYYAVPRDGWEFVRWDNCFSKEAAGADQCSFNIPASLVRAGFGQTAAPLVAEFQQLNPPPVALYSYAIDRDGALVDPMPLEGAQLQRRVAYFTFTGDFESASFRCCKVLDGAEDHQETVDDREAPLVLEVNLALLPNDGGLERELSADLFTSATDYLSHAALWTLASPEITVVRSGDVGGMFLGPPAINNNDEIVWEQTTGTGRSVWSSIRGQIVYMPESRGTYPEINDDGEIIWYELTRNAIVSNTRGIVHSGQCAGDPDPPSTAINNHGEIVWASMICGVPPGFGPRRIVSNIRGTLTFSTNLYISHSDPDINDSGEVVYRLWNGLSDHIYDIYSTERGAITNDVEWQDAVDINNPGEIIWLQRIQDTVTWAVVSNIRGHITSDAATRGYSATP